MAKLPKQPGLLYEEEDPFVRAVSKVIEGEGFVRFEPRGALADRFDLVFHDDNEKLIVVECKTTELTSQRDVETLLNSISEAFGPFGAHELWIVAPSISSRVRQRIDAYYGVHGIEFDTLLPWLRLYKTYRKPRTRTMVATRIVANRDHILIAAATLETLIAQKVGELREQKPNSPLAIRARDSSLSEYEALKARVGALQAAVIEYTEGRAKEQAATRSAFSFGKGVSKWWEKEHKSILIKGYDTSVLLTAVTVCSLLGVNPTLAAGITAVLLRGKTVVDAIKALQKKL